MKLSGEALHTEKVIAIARATAYMHGRQDAGETWDANVIWNFADAYAERAVAFYTEEAVSLPAIADALAHFLNSGQVVE